MRPVRGAPKWEWDAWIDSWEPITEPPRSYPTPKTFYDALSEMEERRPITRYLSGAGSVGVEADPDAPSMFPDAIRGEE
jgi:hypothetical protein